MRVMTLFFGALIVVSCLGPRTDGPIQPSAGITIGLPVQTTAVTWAMPLGRAADSYSLRRVELLDVSGFEVIAIKACEGSPWTEDSYLNCGPLGAAWPPLGVTAREVDGTTIGTGPEQAGAVLVGVKLAAGASMGRIGGVRIYYSYHGAEYLVEEPWVLEMPPS